MLPLAARSGAFKVDARDQTSDPCQAFGVGGLIRPFMGPYRPYRALEGLIRFLRAFKGLIRAL